MTTSLIVLLWICGLVVSLWAISHHESNEITILDLTGHSLAWPLIWAVAFVCILYTEAKTPIWRRK